MPRLVDESAVLEISEVEVLSDNDSDLWEAEGVQKRHSGKWMMVR